MMADMAELIVVTGPPGAGKSTVATLLADLYQPSALVSGDVFFGFISQGYIAPWTAPAHQQNEVVVTAAAAAAGTLARGGYTVVYDGMIGPWFLAEFGSAADTRGLHYVVLLPSERTCLDRVRDRAGHGFTDPAATRHMYAEFASRALDPRHLMDSAAASPAELAATLFQLIEAGRFLVTGPGSRTQTHPVV